MSRRAEHRRNDREAQRHCLTVSDVFCINRMRHLPTDHPSRGLRKHKNKPLRPRMAFPIYSEAAQAWRYLRVIRASTAAQKAARWLDKHPGPQARCTPEVILLAMFLAAEITGRYMRSDLCAVINGLDATTQYHLGLCDNKTFKPISYSEVEDQVLRLERAPFGLLFPGPEQHTNEGDADDDSDDDALSASKVGLIRFNTGVLLASVPKRARAKIAAGAVDATAFPTCGRVRDYHAQTEVDQAIRDAIERGDPDPVPEGVILGADGKLQRCKHDPAARTSHRTASSETNHKSGFFTGYFAKLLTASQDYHYSHNNFHLRYDIGPYVLGLCCDPATDNNAPIARELCLALKEALPGFRTVTADREFTPRISFVQWMHANGIATIMDYQRPQTEKLAKVTVGQRGEVLYQSCGDFFPLALPKKYKTLPDPSKLTEEEILNWFDDRAIWRYVPNGPPDANGTIQFICPQCAGHVRFAAKTRMGKYRVRGPDHPALSSGPPFTQNMVLQRIDQHPSRRPQPPNGNPCRGAPEHTKNSTEKAATASRTPTASSKTAAASARKRAARNPAPGPLARNMAVLALAVVNNVKFADEDPLADPPTDPPCPKPTCRCSA